MDLSEKFSSLTTDAIPDPPRTPMENNTLISEKIKSKEQSESTVHDETIQIDKKKQSVPNTATPITNTDAQTSTPSGSTDCNSTNSRNSKTKTKSKSKQSKNSSVNYHIINSNRVRIGSTTNYICNINQYSSNLSEKEYTTKPTCKPMPSNIQTLSGSKLEITQDDIFLIKTHIGHGWKDVVRKIGYSDGQIEQFIENYKINGIDQVVYHLLLDWKQANTKNACIGNLVNAMWSCQEYDCVERLAMMHKIL